MNSESEINYCKDHLSVCQAECCRQFSLKIPKTYDRKAFVPGTEVTFMKILTKDAIKYYKLHGCKYIHGLLKVPLGDFDVVDGTIIVYNRCEGLTDDCQCKYHGTDKQPVICHKPNKDEHVDLPNITITPNCKYYKE